MYATLIKKCSSNLSSLDACRRRMYQISHNINWKKSIQLTNEEVAYFSNPDNLRMHNTTHPVRRSFAVAEKKKSKSKKSVSSADPAAETNTTVAVDAKVDATIEVKEEKVHDYVPLGKIPFVNFYGPSRDMYSFTLTIEPQLNARAIMDCLLFSQPDSEFKEDLIDEQISKLGYTSEEIVCIFNENTGVSPCSILVNVVRHNRPNLLKFLISRKIDLDTSDKWSQTALMHAIEEGNTEFARILIESGANIAKKDNWNSTALEKAIYKGSVECVNMLMEEGADLFRDYILNCEVDRLARMGHNNNPKMVKCIYEHVKKELKFVKKCIKRQRWNYATQFDDKYLQMMQDSLNDFENLKKYNKLE